MMEKDLRLRQGGMLPLFFLWSRILNPSQIGVMDPRPHILDLTQTTHEVMALVLSKVTHDLLTPD